MGCTNSTESEEARHFDSFVFAEKPFAVCLYDVWKSLLRYCEDIKLKNQIGLLEFSCPKLQYHDDSGRIFATKKDQTVEFEDADKTSHLWMYRADFDIKANNWRGRVNYHGKSVDDNGIITISGTIIVTDKTKVSFSEDIYFDMPRAALQSSHGNIHS